jgi:hypothetical protein
MTAQSNSYFYKKDCSTITTHKDFIMKRNIKIINNKNDQNNLSIAIKQVEAYITNLEPKNYQDIKVATKNISRAALGAHLSVHSITETLDFINQIAHSIVDDITENLTIPVDHANKLH